MQTVENVKLKFSLDFSTKCQSCNTVHNVDMYGMDLNIDNMSFEVECNCCNKSITIDAEELLHSTIHYLGTDKYRFMLLLVNQN